ncbi:MAG: anaerobic ribonucleoside-triphosphate reductase activating protein [Thermosulfidibacteraceae bacterium]|jgi:pyruvate formate lyase activating enzyme
MIGGFQPLTFSDYPGRLASIVFTYGCNYRCPYCYNVSLVEGTDIERIEESTIVEFLESRRRFVSAVVITGGEPTIHGSRLVSFAKELKNRGFLVKLDTNGSNPHILENLVDHIDYCSVDLKTDERRYPLIGGDFWVVLDSVKVLRSADLSYEIRIPMVPLFVDEEMLLFIRKFLMEGERIVLKRFIPYFGTLDRTFSNLQPYPPSIVDRFIEILDGFCVSVI